MKNKGGVLIDHIAKTHLHEKGFKSGNKVYLVRPRVQGKKMKIMSLKERFVGCIRVLLGKGLVVYFKEDEKLWRKAQTAPKK